MLSIISSSVGNELQLSMTMLENTVEKILEQFALSYENARANDSFF